MAMRKPMTDSSNHPKHHSHLSKKISKKQSRNQIATGINTHEEAKMEVSVENSQIEKDLPVKNNAGIIDSDSENQDENLDLNVEDVKKSKIVLEKNQDKIAEISHYLILKNKINAKNAFDIPMLNVKEMSAFNKIEGEFSWKNLSSALEAGAKIYGFRVDSVHSETYKILGGLNRTELEENKEKEGDGNPNSNNEIRAEDLIRKKHEPSDSNTLERNLSNINTQKYDLEFDVDPLFSKTSAKFDEAGSKGLLLNNTSINKNLELLFDIQNPRKKDFVEEIQASSELKKKYAEVSDILVEDHFGKQIFERKLCPEIASFNEEIKNSETIFNMSKYFPSGEKTICEQKPNEIDLAFKDMNLFTESFAISDDNYLNDIDFPDIYQDNHVILEENYDNDMAAREYNNEMYEESNTNMNGQNNINFAHNEGGISKLDEIHSAESKFNLNSIQEKNFTIGTGKTFCNFIDIASTKWMGPDQWKIKIIYSKQKEVAKENDPAAKEKTKKNANPNAIDFNLSTKESLFDILGNNSKKGHATNTIGKSQDNLPIKHLFLLPLDYHIDINRLGRTFLRDPSLNMSALHEEQEGLQSQFNYIERMEIEENVDDDVVIIEADEKNGKGKRVTHKGQIPIKELKEKIWNKLQTLKKFELKEEDDHERMVNENKIEYEEEDNTQQKQKHGYTFGSIIQMLPDIVGETNSRKVSIQTCFVTMLHLANEKILRFSEMKEEQTDFFIEKEKINV